MIRITCLITSLLLTAIGTAQEKNSLLWEIRSAEGEVSYLFGTYHLVGAEYVEAHTKVEKAYGQAETVVVETVIDSSKLTQVAMMGMMPQNSLRKLIDSADYELVEAEIERATGYNLAMLDNVKPMSISAMYAMALAEDNTPTDFTYSGMPIDVFFAADARKRGKKVVALESMMEQAEMLYNSESLEEQAEALVQMVREKDAADDLTEEILRAYQNEDLGKMWEVTRSLGDVYGDLNILVNDRNRNWLDILKPVLEDGKAFIAVGALHLPGDQGLLELLKKEGYAVKAVE